MITQAQQLTDTMTYNRNLIRTRLIKLAVDGAGPDYVGATTRGIEELPTTTRYKGVEGEPVNQWIPFQTMDAVVPGMDNYEGEGTYADWAAQMGLGAGVAVGGGAFRDRMYNPATIPGQWSAGTRSGLERLGAKYPNTAAAMGRLTPDFARSGANLAFPAPVTTWRPGALESAIGHQLPGGMQVSRVETGGKVVYPPPGAKPGNRAQPVTPAHVSDLVRAAQPAGTAAGIQTGGSGVFPEVAVSGTTPAGKVTPAKTQTQVIPAATPGQAAQRKAGTKPGGRGRAGSRAAAGAATVAGLLGINSFLGEDPGRVVDERLPTLPDRTVLDPNDLPPA